MQPVQIGFQFDINSWKIVYNTNVVAVTFSFAITKTFTPLLKAPRRHAFTIPVHHGDTQAVKKLSALKENQL